MRHSSFIAKTALRELLSDTTPILLFLFLPLFLGFRGYSGIGTAKTEMIIPLCLVASLEAVLSKEQNGGIRNHEKYAFVLIGITYIASLATAINCHEHLVNSSGPLFQCAYLLLCVCAARKGKEDADKLIRCMLISCTLNFALSMLQICGGNPFNLYPKGTTYYDSQTLYFGEWLGIMGNIDIASIWLAVCTSFFFVSVFYRERKDTRADEEIGLILCIASGIIMGADAYKVALLVIVFLAPILSPRIREQIGTYAAVCILSAEVFLLTHEFIGWVHAERGCGYDYAGAFVLFLSAIYFIHRALFLQKMNFNKNKTIKARWFLLTYAILALVALLVIYNGSFSDQNPVGQIHNILHGIIDDSYGSGRIQIWRESVVGWKEAVKEKPLRLLFGCGGPLSEMADIRFNRDINEVVRLTTVVKNAHCIYLSWLYEYGLLGLLGTLYLIGTVFYRCIKTGRGERYLLPIAAFLTTCAFCQGQALTDVFVWYFIGAAIAENSEENEKKSKHER